MKRFLVAFGFIFFLVIGNTYANKFSDDTFVQGWSREAIYKMVELGVVSGNEDGTFKPDDQMNRAEFCKVLVLSTKKTIQTPEEASFSDVPVGTWFRPYVETAKKNGWIDGYPDGTFRPANLVNRAEAAKILVNAFNITAKEFEAGAPWYDKYFRVMAEQNLLAYGSDWMDLVPDRNPTRAEITEQTFRFLKGTGQISAFDLPDNWTQIGAVEGEEDDSLSPLVPADPLTPPVFVYEEETPVVSNSAIDPNAGDLYFDKADGLLKNVSVQAGDANVLAHSFKISAKEGDAEISSIQFRRVGNGEITDIKNVWLEYNGIVLTKKVVPTDFVVKLKFVAPINITSGSSRVFDLKVNIADSAEEGSTRFVLYLPEWIDANTASKIGFFPIAGSSILIGE
jgi:hypothetical protein